MSNHQRTQRQAPPLERMSSILAVVDRSASDGDVLRKAVALASHFGASVRLFLCDAEQAFALRHTYCVEGVAEAASRRLAELRRYLEALRSTAAHDASNIEIDIAVESPLHEGVLHALRRGNFDLVLKAPGGRLIQGVRMLDDADRQLIRTCPLPLMIARGRSWRPTPRIAAAVDVSGREAPALGESIAHATRMLASRCGGTVDLIYAEAEMGSDTRSHRGDVLQDLAVQASIAEAGIHVLSGDPAGEIPRFAKKQAYDIVVLGALGHEKGLAGFVGSLTGKLLDSVDADFLLVKSSSHAWPTHDAAVRGFSGKSPAFRQL